MDMRIGNDAATIQSALRQTEGAFDEALLEATSLMQAMIRARQNPAVPVHAGQAAILRLVRALDRTTQAQNDIFRVHDEMSRAGIEYGVFDEKNSTPPSGLGQSDREPASESVIV